MTALTWLVAITLGFCVLTLAVMAFNTYQTRDLIGFTREHFDAEDRGPYPDPLPDPFPVDPDNPPRVMVYDGGMPHLRCVCHVEPLQPGSTVMLFPVPGSKEVRIVCERAIPGRGVQ